MIYICLCDRERGGEEIDSEKIYVICLCDRERGGGGGGIEEE